MRTLRLTSFKCHIWILTLVVTGFSPHSRADFPTTQPFQEVQYRHEQRRNPEISFYVVTVDLSDPDVKLRLATAGPDPDGAGEWQTTLMPVRQIATRERFDVAINASFFTVPSGPTSAPSYIAGINASSVGWTMSDGKVLSNSPRQGWPILWIEGDRTVKIGMPAALPALARHAVTGNGLLIKDGKPVERFDGNLIARHPRTAVGVDRAGTKLIVLTLDGRRPGVSIGMTGAELASEMQRLGCWDAINLDGGGSTTLFIRDPQNDELKLVNQPSGNLERPVSSALGVSIQRTR